MAEDKKPMQADGTDGIGAEVAKEHNPPSAGRPHMNENGGQSGGGAYPNPHQGKDEGGFHGGQSDPGYFGGGQLGSKDAAKSHNAVDEAD